MNINSAIINGTKILEKNNIKQPQLDSEILLAEVLKKDRKYVIVNSNKNLEDDVFKIFKNLIKKRSLGKPIAYLINKKNFWKSEFKIKEGSLIPRPDTEILVQETLKIFKHKKNLNILDIGVGSGCILLSILKEKPGFYGTGIDISAKSINLSVTNAENLHIQNRLRLIKTDVDNFCLGKYDLIISNPPYINKYELKNLERDVRNFEPKLALDGGLDGTLTIARVINKASILLKINGKLIIEIAYNQKSKVFKLLKEKGFYINKTIRDYAQNDRCIISTKI